MAVALEILGVIGFGVAGLLLAGVRAKARLKAAAAPVGQLVETSTGRRHLLAQGDGTPTVVFEAGVGGMGLHWALVQPEVARLTRTVTYDRAGLGWSDPGRAPRTFEGMARELRELLDRAGVLGPYVLVAHSVGGIVARQFARLYPEQVAGMVLVNSAHEEQFKRFPAKMVSGVPNMIRMMKVMNVAFRIGLPALRPEMAPLMKGLPENTAKTERALRIAGDKHMRAMLAEFAAAARNAPAALDTLVDIPLIVLSHGIPQTMPGASDTDNAAYEETWQQMRSDLAALSTRGRRIVAEGCGHDIHLENPALVVEAIAEVIEQVQRSQRAQAEGPAQVTPADTAA